MKGCPDNNPEEVSLYESLNGKAAVGERAEALSPLDREMEARENHLKARKQQLRKIVLAARDALPAAAILAKSAAIAERLQAEPAYREAGTILFFVSMRSEVRTEELIRTALAEGRRVAVPITRLKERRLDPAELRDFDADLVLGTFGVREPKPECYRPIAPSELDLMIMPGVAFDAQGGRTGYGLGLYDRFLKRVPRIVPRIALAYELQMVEEVPMKPYDQRVDLILTEARRIECTRR